MEVSGRLWTSLDVPGPDSKVERKFLNADVDGALDELNTPSDTPM